MQAYGFTDKTRTSRSSSLTTPTATHPARADSWTSSLNSQLQHNLNSKSRKAAPGLHIILPQTDDSSHVKFISEQRHSTDPEAEKRVTFFTPNSEYDLESEASSSICQSPSWENYGRRKKERKAQGAASKANAHKLTKPRPPPSASRTPLLADRQITLPLLPGQYKRGRSASNDERAKPREEGKEKEPKPKHKRERSESLTRRIRASFEGKRSQSAESAAKEQGFLGGLKLQRERRGEVRGAVETSSIHPQAIPVRDQLLSGSEHALGVAGGSPPATSRSRPTSDDRAGPRSPHPLLRHKTAFPERSAPQQNSIYGNLVSPTAPPIPTLPTSVGRENDARERTAAHELETREVVEAAQRQTYHHDDSHEQRHSKQGYPPSVPYSMTAPANAPSTPTSPTRRRASVQLGWHHSTTTAPADEARSPRDASRPENRKNQRSSSAIRNFRDATLSVFQRRSSSRARSQSRDRAAERSSGAASPAQQQSSQHIIEAANLNNLSHMGKPDEPIITNDLDPETMRPPPPIRTHHRPSDGSSISSYETSFSQPSSVTTPNTSRPQSERGLQFSIAPVEMHKNLGDEKPLPSPSEVEGFKFPSTPTPPLGPKSSKRARANHLASEEGTALSPDAVKAEDELWSRSAVPLDADLPITPSTPEEGEEPFNFSQQSLVPQPLTVSPRSSGRVITELPPQAPPKTQVQPQTGGSLPSETADSRNIIIKRQPSLSKSLSSSDLQTIDTSFLPKLKHQPLQQAHKPVPPQHRNLTSPPNFNTQQTTPPSSGANNTSLAASISALSSPPEKHAASYLESARRAAPARLPRRARGSSPAGLDAPPSSPSASTAWQAAPVAKMLVECCHCKFYLDMPSRVYECMVQPEGTVEDPKLGVHGIVTRFVKCPWCSHAMTTRCCAGYAAVVYLKEKLH